jgi:hypothetical protein
LGKVGGMFKRSSEPELVMAGAESISVDALRTAHESMPTKEDEEDEDPPAKTD